MTTITTSTITAQSGAVLTVRTAADLDPDLLAGFLATVTDVVHGHTVENAAWGATTVLGDPSTLGNIWAALIVDIDGVADFPPAVARLGDPLEALRQLAAGHHPAGWPVTDQHAAGQLYRWLGDRASAPILLAHLTDRKADPS
jgi:hypothetical protein